MKLPRRHVQLRHGAAAVGDVPLGSGRARIGRRRLMTAAALAGLGVPAARAHHGWSGFDADRPLYLEGRVVRARWQNPHAELDLEVTPGLRTPADLAQRRLPAQTAAVDGARLMATAEVPRRRDRRWTVELAPLTRMDAWKVPELKPGDTVSVVGFAHRDEQGEPVLRAEYLFVGDRAYGLRSSPAA
ncbi:MAG: hypothetical protein RJA99_507 [Pseudomonadota bacterium]|jgi:hypothetical protein